MKVLIVVLGIAVVVLAGDFAGEQSGSSRINAGTFLNGGATGTMSISKFNANFNWKKGGLNVISLKASCPVSLTSLTSLTNDHPEFFRYLDTDWFWNALASPAYSDWEPVKINKKGTVLKYQLKPEKQKVIFKLKRNTLTLQFANRKGYYQDMYGMTNSTTAGWVPRDYRLLMELTDVRGSNALLAACVAQAEYKSVTNRNTKVRLR